MVELTDPVKYHVLDTHLLPSQLPPLVWLYDYVVAKNGTFKRANNQYLEACINIDNKTNWLPCAFHWPSFRLKIPRLPVSALAIIIDDARTHWSDHGRFIENYYLINNKGVALRPTQKGTAGSVSYNLGNYNMENAIMEVHTHPSNAFFSETDNADEQGFRLYGVLGNIRQARPEFCLRLGVYGDFIPLRADEVFEAGIYDLIKEGAL